MQDVKLHRNMVRTLILRRGSDPRLLTMVDITYIDKVKREAEAVPQYGTEFD